MAKCYITGLDVEMKDAYLLDVGAATRALRGLEQRVAALNRIVDQLRQKDEVEFFDIRRQAVSVRRDRRIVAPTVAQALSVAYPEAAIFISWPEFQARRETLSAKLRAHRPEGEEAAASPKEPGNPTEVGNVSEEQENVDEPAT